MKLIFPAIGISTLIAIANTTIAKDCEKEPNMAATRYCAAEAIDNQLDMNYRDTLNFVRSKDPHTAALLSKAQNSWKTFAEDSCAYSVAARETEEMANDARLNCWATFVEARIKILSDYRKQFSQADW